MVKSRKSEMVLFNVNLKMSTLWVRMLLLVILFVDSSLFCNYFLLQSYFDLHGKLNPMTDFLIFIPFLTFISVLYIFAYVLGQRKKSVVNDSFLLFTFFMMLAPFVDFLIQLSITENFTERLYQVIVPILFSLGFLFLNFVFTLINKPRNTLYWLCFVTCIVSIVVLNFFSPLILTAIPGNRTSFTCPLNLVYTTIYPDAFGNSFLCIYTLFITP